MRCAFVMLAILLAACPARASGVKVVVPVTTVTVHPGDTLTGELVVDREIILRAPLSRIYAATRDAVVGKVARRTLPAGQPIVLHSVREPYLFKEGERVAIVYGRGGLVIRGAAIALEPGIQGGTVSARNLETGIVVRGVVHGDGHVRVGEAP